MAVVRNSRAPEGAHRPTSALARSMSSSLNWKSVAFSNSSDVVVVAMGPLGRCGSILLKSILKAVQDRPPGDAVAPDSEGVRAQSPGGAGTLGKSSWKAPMRMRRLTAASTPSKSSCSVFWVWPNVPSKCG